MTIIATIIHILVCLALILVVLLQADKGEGLSGAFGSGGSGALFGKRGATGTIARLTAGAAIMFMITSFYLYISGWKANKAKAKQKAAIVLEDSRANRLV